MTIVDVMSDAIGSIEFAADALEAPVGSHMRQTGRELKDARKTVADLVDYAERLLQDARRNVADVAEVLGYREAANFSRAFRRWYGASPAAWRRR